MSVVPQREDRIRELFDAAVERPAAERAAFVERECGADGELRGELEALLRMHDEVGDAIHDPDGRSGASKHDTARVARAAFAAGPRPQRDPFSVLGAVERILGSAPRVALHSDEESGGEPLIDPSTPERSSVPKQRGNYQILGEIARGGMGVVLRGHDSDLGRDVALKVLHRELARDPAVLQRFVEEAQIGGQLQHPGVVPVYELGLMTDERPFFTMKLIKGRTLASLLRERASPHDDTRRLLSTFEAVCLTMAYAHSRGVIHRDLKPANVMVGAFGEVQVVDWGLAKVLKRGGVDDERRAKQREISIITTLRDEPGSNGSKSLVGSVMGTPAYMSPEQARGEVERIDERADVFALGAVLTEILTGHPPYVGAARDILELAREGRLQPAFDRLEQCGADVELVDLARHCLSKSPLDRPSSAQVLAEALHEHAAKQAERVREAQIQAAEALVRARAERKVRRLVVALAGVLVLGALGYVGYRAQHAQRVRAVELSAQAALEEASLKQGQGDLQGALAATERAFAVVEAEGLEGQTAERVTQHLAEARSAVDQYQAAEVERARVDAFVALLERARGLQRAETLTSIDPQAAERVGLTPTSRGLPDALARAELHGELLALAPPEKEPRSALDARLRAYGAAFASFDLDVDFEELDTLAARIRATGRSEEIALALDSWALTLTKKGRRDSPAVRRRHLLADAVDASATRSRLRALLQQNDLEGLRELAEGTEIVSESPVTLLSLASALDTLGAEAEARALLERACETHSSDYQLLTTLGTMLRAAGPASHSQARLYLTAARAVKPDGIAAHVALGDLLCSQGQAEKGLRLLNEAVALDPGDENPHAALAATLLQLKRPKEALEELERAVAIGGERERHLKAIAASKLALGDQDGAIAVCRRAEELDPEAGWWRILLADVHDARGEPEAALNVLLPASESDLSVARSLANRLWKLERHQSVVDASAGWLALWPADPLLLVIVATARGKLGDVDGSKETFEEALKVAFDRAQVWHQRCHMLADAGRTEEALDCFQQELLDATQAPDASRRSCALAHASVLLDRSRVGPREVERFNGLFLESCRAALRRDPEQLPVWVELVTLLARSGRQEEALKACDEALAYFPLDEALHYERARSLMRLGRSQSALEGARRLLTEHGVSANACANFGYLFAIAVEPSQRSPEDALAFVDHGLRADADSPYLVSVRGIALFQLGEIDAALADIERGLTLYAAREPGWERNGTISWDWVYLALASDAKGRREDAVRAYHKALELVRLTDHDEERLVILVLHETAGKLGLEAPVIEQR